MPGSCNDAVLSVPGTASLIAYSALALALAMAMLPIYMIAPKFYGDTLGVSLGLLGVALFAVRLVDTVQDPLIGRLVDGLATRPHGWATLMVSSAILLAAGFLLLFHVPESLDETKTVVWMMTCLVIVYTAHSLMNVCYLSWGARLTDDPGGRSRVAGWREASGVVGVVIASVVPAVWVAQTSPEQGYAGFAWVFAAILGCTLLVTLRGSPAPIVASQGMAQHGHAGPRDTVSGWLRLTAPWREAFAVDAVGEGRWLWRLYGFYFFNATAAALPATLILFYIDDVIGRPDQTGLFLGAYFLAGLTTLGLWVKVSDRLGKERSWAAGSFIAAAGLCLAAMLGHGDVWPYLLVCILTGMALGVDLALPPAMLADAIRPEQRSHTGIYFGMWALVAKFALAVAAGVALPALALLGYTPGEPGTAGLLAYVYAFMPLVFKGMAAFCLGRRLWRPNEPDPSHADCA